jgi:TP901 family phage tail tape measure protein
VPEIASAWVTLVASTKGMERDIRKAFDHANRNAKLDPKVDTSKLGGQGESAGRAFGEKFKTALTAVGVGTVGALLAKQLKDALSVGLDWTNTMNTFQSVTNATTSEMDKASAAARQLGTDISLPATSANDAAAAMTELAKGGFSVQQSMDAAKGSLQLAAAAGISATDAATIQSQALQAFGLNASSAGKMSDTLANAANASSAEITDVAYALQAAGTVANQFGLSAEDTAAAVALLANNGIKGSDAGTLLKASLLALTDQGKPAQGAIKELGLTVYDAQGKFVGLHALYQQLGEAAKRMTPEMYQAYTATLFGSDAMRIAGVAAKDGSVSYDQMRTAIDRQGAAADVAAAKTRGLPGAIERVKNNLESLQLKAYDAFQGPVTKLVDKFAAALEGVGNAAEGAGPKVAALFSGLGSSGAVQEVWARTAAAFAGLATAAVKLGPPLATIGSSLATASAALGVSAWQLFVTALEAAAGTLNTIAPLLQGIGNFMSSHQGLVTAAAGAWLLFRTVPGLLRGVSTAAAPMQSAVRTLAGHQGPLTGVRAQLTAIAGDYRNIGAAAQRNGQHLSAFSRLMTATSNNSATFRNMSNAFMGAATPVRGLTAALSAGLAPAMSKVKSAASGLVSALGGPFGAALAGAAVAYALIASKNQQAQQSAEAYQSAIKRTQAAQVDLNEALMLSRGAYNDDVRNAGTSRMGALIDELDTASKKTGSFLDMYRNAGDHSLSGVFAGIRRGGFLAGAAGIDTNSENDRVNREAAAAGRAKEALDALKASNQSLADVTYGGQAAFDAMVKQLDAAGEGGHKAAEAMRDARTQYEAQRAAAERVAPGIKQMSDAMRALSDSTASAADKARALTSALDALNPERGVLAAESAHTQVMERIAEAAKEATDATGGMGDALFKANGALNGAVPNGAALGQSLLSIVDATQQLAAAGDSDAFMKGQQANEAAFAALAQKYGASIAQIKAAADSLGYSDIELVLNLAGADETTQALGAIKKAFDAQPDKKTIEFPTDSIEGAKKKLEELGVKVEDVPDTHTTKITLDDGNSQAILAEIKQALDAIQDKNVSVKINQIATAQNIPQNVVDNSWWGPAAQPRLVGAIVPMADGGFRYMRKPETAGLYAGRGLGTIFAEKDTGGEAYIPLAAGKRQRSRAILTEVARLFGMQVMEDGGITIESLKQYASQVSGRGYVRGGGNGDTFDSDCSGVQATISNYVTGASGRFSTQNEGAALLARGFQQGDPPAGVAAYWIGWQNGGPGGGHTAGTIVDPYGGNVNVEMGGAAGGGQYGGGTGASAFPNRAWIAVGGGEDPRSGSGGGSTAAVRSAQASVTSSKAAVTSAQTALKDAEAKISELKAKGASSDKIDSAEKKRDAAQQRLTAAEQRQDAAETRLAEVKEKAASTAEKGSSGGGDASSLGQSLINGLFSGIGLDGSVFADFREWPNFKSLMAGLNWGGGFLKTILGGQGDGSDDGTGITSSGGGMGIGGLQLPGIADFLKPIGGDQYTTPIAAGPHPGSGAAPGPTAPQGPQVVNNFNGNLGVNPTEFHQKTQAKQNQAVNRNLGAVRPR